MESFGRYELRRRLGVGGMAEVYEAVAVAEHGIEKPLVIKRILEEHSSDQSFQEMFRDEARVAMRLNHPNVVQVFDFGKADGRYFLAMELVRGKDLAAIISRVKQEDRIIPAGVAIFIAGEAAKGLDHAHRLSGPDGKPLGIVHRDISPQNILVSTEGTVKVGDFGIAKFNTRADKTQVATVRGKVRYMSPEQADGGSLDGRSDLFSLALVLYEMVTGTFAFDGRTDLDVLDQVRRCDPRKPSSITNVPAGLEAIILRALSREPKHRYSRGNEFQRELESFSVDKGLRATSGALAEFLNTLFPDLESRSSPSDGVTNILRLPSPAEKATSMRRVVAEDGIPTFVSEEVKLPEPVDTRESALRRPDEETTAQPGAGTGEVTATQEASGVVDPDITDLTFGGGATPRSSPPREAQTVVPGSVRASASEEMPTVARAASPAPAPEPRRTGPATPSRTRQTAPSIARPAPTSGEPAFPRPTLERAPVNPLVAASLRERTRDPIAMRILPIAAAVLVAVFFLVTLLKPYLPKRSGAPKEVVTIGGNGAVSVIGRTGDHVTLIDRQGETVLSISLPFQKLEIPAGAYKVIVEGPFDGERIEGELVVPRNETAIFDAIRAAERNRTR